MKHSYGGLLEPRGRNLQLKSMFYAKSSTRRLSWFISSAFGAVLYDSVVPNGSKRHFFGIFTFSLIMIQNPITHFL